jgi:lipoprotein-anchoring transpeptidase ErfK/SrfK
MKRFFLLSFVALMLATVALVSPSATRGTVHAAAQTPQATTSQCASSLGSLIQTIDIKDGSTVLGYVNIYYNSSNGYNCMETTSASATYGVSKVMDAYIVTCKETSPSTSCIDISESAPYYADDEGNYSYYAGPVGVYGAGHCIYASGYIYWKGQYYFGDMSGAGHCA